jgi:putative spermidine/putrescine transport system substrate-binding protein
MNRRLVLVLAGFVVAIVGAVLLLYRDGGLKKLGLDSGVAILGLGDDVPEAQRNAYFRPFTSETEISVKESDYDGRYEQLTARLKGDNPPDIVQVDASGLLRGVKDDLFLPIDYNVVQKGEVIPQAAHEFGVGTNVYSIAMGWNASRLPEKAAAPKSWADFWDVKKYPGGRALKKSPRFTLEIALMADGVAPGDVYKDGKLNVDRAFRKLDELKPHVKNWWTGAKEPVQMLASGEIVMAAARGERLSTAAHEEEPKVKLTWNQGVASFEYWAVSKNAHKPEQAMRFIAYANQSHRQATFATLIPLGPTNPKAFDHIEAGFGRRLCSHRQNLSQQIFLNAGWWAEYEEEMNERFEKWLEE